MLDVSQNKRSNGTNGANGGGPTTYVPQVIQPAPLLHADGSDRRREVEGWRTGKPVEDPDKLKRWGRIVARPSEYLIHMRRGKVRPASSGQGASCFKFPGDAVAIVPTTVQKLQFFARQVTREKVGIEVTGLAVYRIAEPLIAFRMLNFSFPERAQEKLAELLGEMFVGASRRLVANLGVDDCLTRRKEGLAEELMREIAPVVSGNGRVEDDTDRGWGVVIDTIEIQDVRILSDAVFSRMQAGFRQEQERRAREAELATERAVKLGEAEAERAIELERLSARAEIDRRRRETDEVNKLSTIASEARTFDARIERERVQRNAEVTAAHEAAIAKLEADLTIAQRRKQAEEATRIEAVEAEARVEQKRLAHAAELETRRAAMQIEQVKREAAAEIARHEAELTMAQRRRLAEESARTEAVEMEARIEATRLAHWADLEARRAAAALENVKHEAETEAARHAIELAKAQQAIALGEARRALAEHELALAEIEMKKMRLAQALEIEKAQATRAIENMVSREVIELAIAQRLPDLAAAFQQKMGTMHVTAVDGASPFGPVTAAIEGVMGLARSAGLTLPKRAEGSA